MVRGGMVGITMWKMGAFSEIVHWIPSSSFSSFWAHFFLSVSSHTFSLTVTRVVLREVEAGVPFAVVRLLSQVQLFVTPWNAAHQASLSFSIFWSLLKLMSIESLMPSNYLILCCPLLLLPSIFQSRIFMIPSPGLSGRVHTSLHFLWGSHENILERWRR